MNKAFLFFIFTMNFALSKETPLDLCLDQKLNIDVKCKCRDTKKCFHLIDASYKTSIKKAANLVGEAKVKSLHRDEKEIQSSISLLFSGVLVDSGRIKELRRSTEKKKKLNEKKMKKIEEYTSKKYGKKYDVRKRAKKIKEILVKQMDTSKIKLRPFLSQRSRSEKKTSISSPIEQNILKDVSKENPYYSENDPKKSDLEQKMAQALEKKYEFNYIATSDSDLFQNLTRRYQQSYHKLDPAVISGAINQTSKEDLIRIIKSQIQNFQN